jgi:hypothetical protein
LLFCGGTICAAAEPARNEDKTNASATRRIDATPFPLETAHGKLEPPV